MRSLLLPAAAMCVTTILASVSSTRTAAQPRLAALPLEVPAPRDNPTTPERVALGPGYGVWLRTGDREFAGTFVGNIYDLSTGQIIGKYKVKSRGTLQNDRATFTGVFQTETFDLAGGLVSTVTGSIAARRIQVETLP